VGGLKKTMMNGAKWTTISSLTSALLGLLLLTLLTRILDKTDFGLMAIISIISIFSNEVVDMGISQAIIQKQKATKNQLSSLFWINVLLGIVVMIALNLAAPLVVNFYNEPQLQNLMFTISFVFIFNAVTSQYQAIFQRDFKFKRIAIIDMVSVVIYFVSTLLLGLKGFGVLALVYGTLIRSITKAVLFFMTGFKEYSPRIYFNYIEMKEFLSFGLFRFGTFSINYFNKKLDSIIIGKFLGMEALGVYEVYQRILRMPVQVISPVINKVTFPLFSKIHKDKIQSKSVFLKLLNYLNTIRFPIYLFLIAAAEPFIELVLGGKWIENVLVFRILAGIFMLRTVSAYIGTVMVSFGKANWGLYISLIMLCITPISIYIGMNWGVLGIVSAVLIVSLLSQIPRFDFIVKRLMDIGFIEYSKNILNPLILSVLAGAVTFFVQNQLNNVYIRLGVSIGLFGAIYFVLTYYFNNSILSILKTNKKVNP
jgi:O-antigen/teichoic acid export membrane protein